MKALKILIVSSLVVIAACAHSESGQLAGASADPGPGAQSAASSQDTDDGWPRTLSSGSDQITIYQPQIESWDGSALQGRAAVSVQLAASSQPVYGVVWFSARTEVDKENHLVTLEDVQLTKTSFPSQPDRAAQYGEAIAPQLSSGIRTIALDRLEASLAVTRAEQQQATVPVKNTAPARFLQRDAGFAHSDRRRSGPAQGAGSPSPRWQAASRSSGPGMLRVALFDNRKCLPFFSTFLRSAIVSRPLQS